MSQTEIATREEDNGQFSAPTTPTSGGRDWIQPGLDIEITGAEIDNQLTRNRQPDEVTSIGSRVGNFEGSIDLTWTYTDDKFHDISPLKSGSLGGSHRLAPTFQLYLNTTYFDASLVANNQPLAFAGCAFESLTINYEEGGLITVDATIGLGEPIADPAPSSIVTPSAGDVYAHHGSSFTVDGVDQSGVRSASLSMPNLAYRSGQADRRTRAWKVAGDPEVEFTIETEYTEADQLQTAIGGSDVTSIEDFKSSFASTSMTLENGQAVTVTYTLSELNPSTASLNNLAAPGDDVAEEHVYHVGDVSV